MVTTTEPKSKAKAPIKVERPKLTGEKAAESVKLRNELSGAVKAHNDSWIFIAEKLKKVRDEELYLDWGHPSMLAYCTGELGMSKAKILTFIDSYEFLQRRQPEYFKQPADERPAPIFEAVEVLARAEKNGLLDQKDSPKAKEKLDASLAKIWRDEEPALAKVKTLEAEYPPVKPQAKTEKEKLGTFSKQFTKVADEIALSSLVPNKVKEEIFRLSQVLADLAKTTQVP